MAIANMNAKGRILRPVCYQDILGWHDDEHRAALGAFRKSCEEIESRRRSSKQPGLFDGERYRWHEVCEAAKSAIDARRFFETHFTPFRVHDADNPGGLFTGYYEPEVLGSIIQTETYRVPIYRAPGDLVALPRWDQEEAGVHYGRIVQSRAVPYFTRKEIEQGALSGRGLEIVWLKDWVDAYFIHVQGCARVKLTDGSVIRLSYAAKSGRPYTGIGALLVKRGAFTVEAMSMQSIRHWMMQDETAARELMWQNESFVFFNKLPLENPDSGPPGAQNVPLTARRSVAVDTSIWTLGTPMWIDTRLPAGCRYGERAFRYLLVAQDTGSAIRGPARGDIFWGAGAEAADIAGHMKSPGSMVVLLPHEVARHVDAMS